VSQLQEIFETVKSENARSKEKYGLWKDRPEGKDVGFEAISSEVDEWMSAFCKGDIHGPHGELAELYQIMNVCARRIMFLQGEDNA